MTKRKQHWTRLTKLGYMCRCACGTERFVRAEDFKKRKSTSCGCRVTHGLTKHPLYHTYRSMRARCENPRHDYYPNYGARGIKVCRRWKGLKGLENFIADMGDRPEGLTLDRIDVNKGYAPDNCRWATKQEQEANKQRNGHATDTA